MTAVTVAARVPAREAHFHARSACALCAVACPGTADVTAERCDLTLFLATRVVLLDERDVVRRRRLRRRDVTVAREGGVLRKTLDHRTELCLRRNGALALPRVERL